MGKIGRFFAAMAALATGWLGMGRKKGQSTKPAFPEDKNSKRLQAGITLKDWISAGAASRLRIASLIYKSHYLWYSRSAPRTLVVALNYKNALRKLQKMLGREVFDVCVVDYRDEWEREHYNKALAPLHMNLTDPGPYKMRAPGRILTYDRFGYKPEAIPVPDASLSNQPGDPSIMRIVR